MILTFLAARPKYESKLKRILYCVMMDKAKTSQIRWNHIEEANQMFHNQNQMDLNSKNDVAFPIEVWDNCNIHEESFFDRLNDFQIPLASSDSSSDTNGQTHTNSQQNHQFAMIGIHLCKTLSPRCISIFNMLGTQKAPFLCLAPCCLPRFSYNQSNKSFIHTIPINLYQTPQERKEYQDLLDLRNQAIGRKRQSNTKFGNANSNSITIGPAPCWKCGKLGHFKADCPTILKDEKGNVIKTSRPPRPVNPNILQLNVDLVRDSSKPFDTYCELLKDTVQLEDSHNNSLCINVDSLTPFFERKRPTQSNEGNESPFKKQRRNSKTIDTQKKNEQTYEQVKLMEVHMIGNAHSGQKIKASKTKSFGNHQNDRSTSMDIKSVRENWNASRKCTWIVCER